MIRLASHQSHPRFRGPAAPGDAVIPWYYDFELPPNGDLAWLRPPKPDKNGKNRGFETFEEADHRDQLNIKVLKQGGPRSRQLAEKLTQCSPDNPCGSSACKKCMREFRRAHTGMALGPARRLKKAGLTPVLLTLVWTDPNLRGPTLPDVCLAKLQQRLRMALRRAGLSHVPMIGGLEVDWNEHSGVWDLHGHFVAFVNHQDELEPLRRHFSKANGVSRPMHTLAISRLSAGLAYCWKFAPMRKVKYMTDGKTHTRKMRLSDQRLRAALIWLDRHDPNNFIFLQGLRRGGRKLVEA